MKPGKYCLTLILTALLIMQVSAQTIYENEEELNNFKQEYNSQISNVPNFVGNIVGGETINVNLKTNNTSNTVGVKFEGLKIQNISNSDFENPTMRVNTTENSIKTILKSKQPYKQLQEKLEDEEISYESTNIGSSIKLNIFETLGGLASKIGLKF